MKRSVCIYHESTTAAFVEDAVLRVRVKRVYPKTNPPKEPPKKPPKETCNNKHYETTDLVGAGDGQSNPCSNDNNIIIIILHLLLPPPTRCTSCRGLVGP